MAIYHLSTKPISRSSGRSAVASVAYRAGIKITDDRLGKTYDYTKRNGVLWTGMATPHGLNIDRNELWNLAEKTETRSNSRTAREIVINIPHELMSGDQSAGKMLAYEFATNLSQKYQIAVDIAVHAPDKQGDNRNYHAHLLLTTRQITQEQDGRFELGKKSQLEMSNAQLKQAGLLSNQDELKEIRREWAELANTYLAEHGLNERIDHRSHKDRGLLTLPTVKMGWQATELERQGVRTDVGDQNRAIKAYNEQVLIYQGLQRQARQAELERAKQAEQQHQEQTRRQAYLERAKTAQKAQTHENAQKGTLKSYKPKSATLVPTTPPKRLQSENKAVSERFKLTSAEINQRHAFLANSGLKQHEQTATRQDRASTDSTARHDTASASNARQQRQGYNRVAELVKTVNSNADRATGTLANTVQAITEHNQRAEKYTSGMDEVSQRLRNLNDRTSKRITRVVQASNSTHTEHERVSEYDSTANRARERYESIRERARGVSDVAEQNNQLSTITKETARTLAEIASNIEIAREKEQQQKEQQQVKASRSSYTPRMR